MIKLTELQKYQLINSSSNIEELKNNITTIGDITISNGDIWSSEKMNEGVDLIVKGYMPFNRVTRNYGIRQQLIYLIHVR